MGLIRHLLGAAALACIGIAAPASAQFFFKNPDLSGPPMNGNEAELGYSLPGATPAELRAGILWSMRAALNVAALQCQFEPTLLTVENYNAILIDHKVELKNAVDTLTKYFIRTNKTKARGIAELDRFGTRLYSSFSTVSTQYVFCLTAASVERQAMFTPRGKLGELAVERMGELRRSSVKPYGEQRFPMHPPIESMSVPRLDPNCWDKRGRWDKRRCGAPDKQMG